MTPSFAGLAFRHTLRSPVWSTFRLLRTPTPGYRHERVTTSSDGAVVICWHPEPKFPYEMSRPVPRGRETAGYSTDTKMQVRYVEDMKELYHHKPNRFKVSKRLIIINSH